MKFDYLNMYIYASIIFLRSACTTIKVAKSSLETCVGSILLGKIEHATFGMAREIKF